MAHDKLKAVLNNIKVRFMLEQMKKGRLQYERGNKTYILQLFQRHMLPVIQLEKLRQEVIDKYMVKRRQENKHVVRGRIAKLDNRKKQRLLPKNCRAILNRKVGEIANCDEVSRMNCEGELTAVNLSAGQRPSVRRITLRAWNNKPKRNGLMHCFRGKRHRKYDTRTTFIYSKRAKLLRSRKTGQAKHVSLSSERRNSKASIRKRKQALSARWDRSKYTDTSDALTNQPRFITSSLDISGNSEILTQSNEEWSSQCDRNSYNIENGESLKTDNHSESYTSADQQSMTDGANHPQTERIKPEGTGDQTFVGLNDYSASKTKWQPDAENKTEAVQEANAKSDQQADGSTTEIGKAIPVTKTGCLGYSLNSDDTSNTSGMTKIEEDEIKILEVVSLAEYVHSKECVDDITDDATKNTALPDLIPPKKSNDSEPLDLTLGILDLSVKARFKSALNITSKATSTGLESNSSDYPPVMTRSENAYFPSAAYDSIVHATNTCQQPLCAPSRTLSLRSTSAEANKHSNSSAAEVLFESIEQTVLTYGKISDSCTPVTHTSTAVTVGHIAEYTFPSAGQTVPGFRQTSSMEDNTTVTTSSNNIIATSKHQLLQVPTQEMNNLANESINLAANVRFPQADYGNDWIPLSMPPTNKQGSNVMTVSRSSTSHISGMRQKRNIPHCVPVQEFHPTFQLQNQAFQQFNQSEPRFSYQSNQSVHFESRVIHDPSSASPLQNGVIKQSSNYAQRQQQQQPQGIHCVSQQPTQNHLLQARPLRQSQQKSSVQDDIVQQTVQNLPLNNYYMQQSPQNTSLPSAGVQQVLQNQQLPSHRQVQNSVINQPPPNVVVQNIPFQDGSTEPQPQQAPLQNCVIQQAPRKPSLQNSAFQQAAQNIPLQSDVIQSSPPRPLSRHQAIKQFPQNTPLQDRVIQQPPQHPSVQLSHRPSLGCCVPYAKPWVTEVTDEPRMPAPNISKQPTTQNMVPRELSTVESTFIKRPPPSYEASIMLQQHIQPQDKAVRPLRMPAIRSSRKPRVPKTPKNTGVGFPSCPPNTELRTFQCSATTLTAISCNACDKMALFLCSRCKRVAYCSQQCQAAAWKNHSAKCHPH